MNTIKADALGIQEHNLNLRILKGRSDWKSRFRKWNKVHTSAAYNMHNTSSERLLYGGTAIFIGKDNFHRVNGDNVDPSGLGRWNWTLLQGRHGMNLRIISVYRPNTDTSNRPGTVFSQQEKVLLQHHDTRNPRSAIFDDLEECISRWHSEGDNIIMGMDANEDTRTSPSILAARCGLVSATQTAHPDLAVTATCNKNRSDIPVDGIWCSPGLDIQQCGMAGFGEIKIGRTDHRILWVDVSKLSAFGYQPPTPQYSQPNRLNVRDPRCVERYVEIVRQGHIEEELLSRLMRLVERCKVTGPTEELQTEFDKLIRIDKRIRDAARKACRKLRMGKVAFSDEIQKFHRAIHMWNLIITRREGNRVDTRKIRNLMRQTGNPTALRQSLGQAKVARKQTMRRYRKKKKQAEQLRTQFSKRVAQRRAIQAGTTVDTQERIIKSAFRQKGSWRRINAVMSKERHAISYVTDGPKDDLQHHHSKEEIERALMKEGETRFLQAYGTDFTVPPLSDDFPHLKSEAVDQVLQGTYVAPEGTGEYAIKLLRQMTLCPGVPLEGNIGAEFDVDRHIAGWSKMKSRTSSSPFGPSFVDYIAGSTNDDVATVDCLMGYIPTFMGLLPKEWSHVIDAMIPKKKDSTHVERMRMIVLFHALQNFQNKHFGGRMVRGMEDRKQIPLEAGGSRKNHRAIESALNKVFTTDHIRQRHLTAALCSNDAKSCYDRILHIIAEICMRRAGLIKEPCYFMLGSMEEMHHHIRTVYGDSSSSYTAIAIRPFQGIYQGNGAGPAIWLIVSVVVINMLKEEGFGLKSETAITGDGFELVCYTFVDDTDLIHCLPAGNSDTNQLVLEMQSMLDHWEGGISATGGALVPAKSYWFLMSFYWKNNRWYYRTIRNTPGKLTIKDTNGIIHELDRLSISDARETLGTWIAMDGNSDAQYDALVGKIMTWGSKIRARALSRTDAIISLRSSLAMSLQYPLAACTIPRIKLKELTKILMKTVLPFLGIPKGFPRDLLHVPDLQLGYQLPCLDVEAGFAQIELLLRNLHDPKLTGRLLHDTYETFQLEMGVGENPLCYDFKKWKVLTTKCWITNIWEFCDERQLQILTPSIKIPLLRQRDCFLTKAFVAHGWEGEELRILNLCRKWHKVSRLSEIVTGDGRFIRQAVRSPKQCTGDSQYNWPQEGKPTQGCWTLWNKAIDLAFVNPHGVPGQLAKPLGDWICVPKNWSHWYSSSDDRIFERHDTSISYFVKTSKNTRRPRFTRAGTVPTLPTDARPTTCYGTATALRHEGTGAIRSVVVNSEQSWWNRYIWDTDARLPLFVEGVRNNTAVIICDGSYKDNRGTAATIALPAITSIECVIAAHTTPGPKDQQNPYRAELAGILASVIMVEEECKKRDVTTGTITIGCDCETALGTYLYCRTNRPKPSSKHYDITSQLFTLLHKSTFVWEGKDIMAHQDDIKPYEELDVWEQWNVDADLFAKNHWAEYAEETPYYNLLPFEEPSIWRKRERITSWDKTELYRHLFQPDTINYLVNRYDFEEPHSIAFDAMGTAFKGMMMHKRLWISKLLTNRLPTMKNLSRWKNEEVPNMCPRCGLEEDATHITWCQSHGAQTRRNEAIDKLEVTLFQTLTKPELRQRILSLLSDHMTPTSFDEIGDITPELMTKGFILESWIESQQQYYEWLERRNTGKRWATRLIQQLWEISWDMWNHRKKIEESPESLLLAQQHVNLNELIFLEFQSQHEAPNQHLHRWFSRPLMEVYSYNLHTKEQWLEVVSTVRQAHNSMD